MYSEATRARARSLRSQGQTWSQISRVLGISRSTLRAWETPHERTHRSRCPRCDSGDLDHGSYAALLGFYLGDGCLSTQRGSYALRVSCDARLHGIITDVTDCITRVRESGAVFSLHVPGAVMVTAFWKHWPCLFPQHGPGRKHERPIVLTDWQRRIVEEHPAAFLRGLFHADGSRVNNWATRPVGGVTKRYDYPRWQFSNTSSDIRGLCCWALDLVEIPWRHSRWNHVSVSRREAVARLDELIGLKH